MFLRSVTQPTRWNYLDEASPTHRHRDKGTKKHPGEFASYTEAHNEEEEMEFRNLGCKFWRLVL